MRTVKLKINCDEKHCGRCPFYQNLSENRYCLIFKGPWRHIMSSMLEWDSEVQQHFRLKSCMAAEK